MKLEELYKGYNIISIPFRKAGRWGVSASIHLMAGPIESQKNHFKDEKITYILEIEAAKEGINLGKRMIDRNMHGFGSLIIQ
jgi:hypothetical protein